MMRANLTYAASEPGTEDLGRWVFTHGRVVGAG